MPYRTPSQKLAGDPGIFGTLGKILGTVAGVASSILPGPLSIPTRIIAGALQKAPQTPPFVAPRLPGGAVLFQQAPQVPKPGTRGAIERFVPGGHTGFIDRPKRRRMDPMNVKALRRATRRLAAFDREKKKVEKQLRAIAPRPARRSRRDAPAGHTHVR